MFLTFCLFNKYLLVFQAIYMFKKTLFNIGLHRIQYEIHFFLKELGKCLCLSKTFCIFAP